MGLIGGGLRAARAAAPRGAGALVLGLLLLGAVGGAQPGDALAEACPGAGAGSCPYARASIIGQRAEGVLRFPEAVALDPQGNVFVADQLGFVVQKFSASGAFLAEWGSYGGGHGQFGPIGGLATDAAGDVYVVDSNHNRVEKFDNNGAFITAWGHTGSGLGQFHFYSSLSPSQPPGGGIAVAGGYVYVADSGNNRIERFSLAGGEAMTWGSRGSGPGQFSYPRGVAANAGEVLVADDDNHRIEKFDPNGIFQSMAGTQGAGPGQFGFPYGVALDAAGNAYVADDLNHRVVKLTPGLAFQRAFGGFGAGAGQLAFPRALAVDASGEAYVTDTANGRVEVFDREGNFLRSLGAPGRSLSVLTGPRGLAADPSGRLIASDSVANRIELYAPASGAFTAAWEGPGGPRPYFRAPAGIAVDARGSLYIADQGDGRVLHLWGDGTFLSELGGPGALGGASLAGPTALALDAASGVLYVADSVHNRVLVYGPEGTLRASWGAGNGSGAAGSGEGQFNYPAGLAVDAGGNVFVADEGNDRVLELSSGGAILRQWGSRGSSDGRFHAPSAVGIDGAAHLLYVLDRENNRVQVFDTAGRFLAGWGLRGTDLGEFSQPTALAVDCAGAVYVADTNNNRVERFDPRASSQGCLPVGAWPPPLDVAPVLSVSLVHRAGVLAHRQLSLLVGCQRECRVLVSATLRAAVPRGRPVRLLAASRAVPAALPAHVRVRVGAGALRTLRRALGRHSKLIARVSVVAVGPTGRRSVLARTFALTR